MDKTAQGRSLPSEAQVPTDLLASLIIEQAISRPLGSKPSRLSPKIYGIMAVTTMLTFATLMVGYQFVFSPEFFG